MTPQAATILRHLRTKGSITRVEAEAVYRIRQIPTPIYALRSAGYPVDTEFRQDATGQRYARYSLPVAN